MALPQSSIDSILDKHPVARLATLDPHKKIHQIPIVFVRHENKLWSPVDGKPKSGVELKRVRNIHTNPNVSVLLDAYEQDWSRLWWLQIEATAEILQADLDENVQLATVSKLLRRKYHQYQHIPLLIEPPTFIVMSLKHIKSWCADDNFIPY